eukprot:Nitzschia sp. Nitz4//scaffold16_size188269//135624//136154//NITZ4_001808-RA/size188269-processed-gene-0.65-mRNA-1//1//CDS//3329538568//3775//frame0
MTPLPRRLSRIDESKYEKHNLQQQEEQRIYIAPLPMPPKHALANSAKDYVPPPPSNTAEHKHSWQNTWQSLRHNQQSSQKRQHHKPIVPDPPVPRKEHQHHGDFPRIGEHGEVLRDPSLENNHHNQLLEEQMAMHIEELKKLQEEGTLDDDDEVTS